MCCSPEMRMLRVLANAARGVKQSVSLQSALWHWTSAANSVCVCLLWTQDAQDAPNCICYFLQALCRSLREQTAHSSPTARASVCANSLRTVHLACSCSPLGGKLFAGVASCEHAGNTHRTTTTIVRPHMLRVFKRFSVALTCFCTEAQHWTSIQCWSTKLQSHNVAAIECMVRVRDRWAWKAKGSKQLNRCIRKFQRFADNTHTHTHTQHQQRASPSRSSPVSVVPILSPASKTTRFLAKLLLVSLLAKACCFGDAKNFLVRTS